MRYIVLCISPEGKTDFSFLSGVTWRSLVDILIEQDIHAEVQEQILFLQRDSNENRSNSICSMASEVDIFLIHFDASNNGRDAAFVNIFDSTRELVRQKCGAVNDRLVPIWTCREMEAWVLSDPDAIARSIGFDYWPPHKELVWDPRSTENIENPKSTLNLAVRTLTNGKQQNFGTYFEAIGLEIHLNRLENLASYREFRSKLQDAVLAL